MKKQSRVFALSDSGRRRRSGLPIALQREEGNWAWRRYDAFSACHQCDEARSKPLLLTRVGKSGVVYQKDLGEQSANVPMAVTEYDPGDGWTPLTH